MTDVWYLFVCYNTAGRKTSNSVLLPVIHTGSGADPAFHSIGIGVVTPGTNQPQREADHWPLCSVEVMSNGVLYIHSTCIPA